MNKKHTKENIDNKYVLRIKELEEKLAEAETNWKRALADYQNLQKRSDEEKSVYIEYANTHLIEQLLPVLDNFRKLEDLSSDIGLKITVKELKLVLEKAGLKVLDVKRGNDFDPHTMDAIDTDNGEENKITAVVRDGYTFKNKLIRPASVNVGNGNKKED